MDNFERFGVTADWKKVLPGMVYVDLQESKSRKEIYNAYHNGASLIFTTQNISNPELPVIKVNNVYETMLLMLNNHFHSPQDKVKLIAISGSDDKDIVLDLLHNVMGEKSEKLNLKSENGFSDYFNSLNSMTIEDMYEYLNKIASLGEHIMPIIVDYKLKYFKFINSFKFDCALITGVNSVDVGDKNYVLSSIRSFVSQIPQNKPIIVNNDDDMMLKALEGGKNAIVITYGLNKKAAVTATSIDVNQQTTFNYCLQRSFKTNSGILIEPCEMPITMNLLGSRSIYNALAVITCALYYDADFDYIKTALQSYIAPYRRFELSVIQGITVLDNYCSSAGELDKTLEGIQLLNYNKLRLLLAANKNESSDYVDNTVKVVCQWGSILGMEEVVICGCLDINNILEPLSINDIRKLKKALKGLVQVKYIEKLQDAIEYISLRVKESDMLVLAGGEEMNNAKMLLGEQLKMNKAIKALH